MDERIAQFADIVTAGLTDDPELRLDVRREVITHLEEAAAEHAEAEDPAGDALADFGTPEAVAEELLAANRRRMGRRARAVLLLRAVVLPAAILTGVLVLLLGPALSAWRVSQAIERPFDLDEPRYAPALAALPSDAARARFLFTGDLSRPTEAEQQRAIWEADPTNRAAFARYALAVHATPDREGARRAEFQAVFRQGQALDPENALYDYLLADLHLRGALTYDKRKDPKTDELVFTPRVRDEAILRAGLADIRRAAAKPICTGRAAEHLARVYADVPVADARAAVLRDLATFGGLRDYTPGGRVTDAMVVEGVRLLRAGKAVEAEPYLDFWRTAARQRARALAERDDLGEVKDALREGKDAARIVREAGFAAAANTIMRRVERIHATLERHMRIADDPDPGGRTTGGIASLFVGRAITSTLSPREQYTLRKVTHANLEHLTLAASAVGLLCALLGCGIAEFAIARRRDTERTWARSTLPPCADTVRLCALVVMPALLYLAATRLFGAGDALLRAFGPPGFLAALLVLAVASAIALAWSMARITRRRCRMLDLGPLPTSRQEVASVTIMLVVALAPPLVGHIVLGHVAGEWVGQHAPASVGLVVLAFLLWAPAVLGWYSARGALLKPPAGYATLGLRYLLAPLLTCVLLAGLALPMVRAEEAYWVRQSALIGAPTYPSPPEAAWLAQVRESLVAAMSTEP